MTNPPEQYQPDTFGDTLAALFKGLPADTAPEGLNSRIMSSIQDLPAKTQAKIISQTETVIPFHKKVISLGLTAAASILLLTATSQLFPVQQQRDLATMPAPQLLAQQPNQTSVYQSSPVKNQQSRPVQLLAEIQTTQNIEPTTEEVIYDFGYLEVIDNDPLANLVGF